MTISSTSNKIIYSGNGATTSFPFTFPAIAAADILAYYTDSAGTITTLTQGTGTTQYQVTLSAVVLPNPTSGGGTVTYNPSGVPIASGTTLTIIRTMPLTQATSLASQGNIYPAVIEQSIDALLAQIQQVNELLGRSIAVAVSDNTPSTLPPTAQRSGKFLGFDTSGNPIAATQVTGTAVSSAMAPVITAATLAAGRTAFGLGAIATEGIGTGLQDDGSSSVRVNLEVTTSESTNQAVTSAFHNTQRLAIGPITYTLPRANTLWNGFGFKIENSGNGGDVTLAININDVFYNYTSGTSFIFGRGASLEIWTDAANLGTWYYRFSNAGKKLVGDAAYTITPADQNIFTSAALTSSRTWTLPSANAVRAGTQIIISDQANAITSTNTLVVSRAGTDTIVMQGTTVTSFTLFTAGANISLVSDGALKWSVVGMRMGVAVQRIIATGTYTATVGSTRQRVTLVGPGGGGGGATANVGAAGLAASSFQVNATGTAWTANPGGGGNASGGTGGAGGTGGTDGSAGTKILRSDGTDGGRGGATVTANTIMPSGMGGTSCLPGAGNSTQSAIGGAAKTNSGGGGAGGGGNSGTTSGSGAGGGESVSFWVTGMTTATVVIGGAGTGGAAGTNAGGAGAAGIAIVEEFFD